MIIIRYYEWLKLFKEERYPIFELCNDKYECKKELTRDEAREMIKKNHLRLVYHDKNGDIWES